MRGSVRARLDELGAVGHHARVALQQDRALAAQHAAVQRPEGAEVDARDAQARRPQPEGAHAAEQPGQREAHRDDA